MKGPGEVPVRLGQEELQLLDRCGLRLPDGLSAHQVGERPVAVTRQQQPGEVLTETLALDVGWNRSSKACAYCSSGSGSVEESCGAAICHLLSRTPTLLHTLTKYRDTESAWHVVVHAAAVQLSVQVWATVRRGHASSLAALRAKNSFITSCCAWGDRVIVPSVSFGWPRF